MRIAGQWMLIFVLALGFFVPPASAASGPGDPPSAVPGRAPALQGALLAMTSPTACPGAGCAAGQRLNMRYDFIPSGLRAATEPDRNLKICIYAPNSWAVGPESVIVAETGEITGKSYVPPEAADAGCTGDDAKPNGYSLIMERVAALDQNTFADALGFGFNLGVSASGSGRVLARLLTHDGARWNVLSSQQATSTPTLTILPTSSRVFVANDAASCGTGVPCYINSGDDLPGGYGTGLRDAVDAAPVDATIYVMGSYQVKGYPVNIYKKVVVTGHSDSRISYGGQNQCSNAILMLTGEVTLRELNISDGVCTNPSRNLIEVNASANVLIERNDLTGGKDAITIADNTGGVTVRFNSIANNTGYAVRAAGATGGAPLLITGNNIISQPVNCAESATEAPGNRRANHNYWGSSTPTEADSKCKIDANKRLGMPIALETNAPGVRAQQVTVTDTRPASGPFDNQISYKRTGGEDFPLVIVDHGYGAAGGPPFSYTRYESPSPCSNYWDVFLPDGVNPSGALELFFKYDRTTSCMATINSSQYCDQTSTVSKYPLYWYNPAGTDNRWITTGSKLNSSTDGQVTTCEGNNEIRVVLDNNGRPSLDNDLRFVPFMVGVPVIRSFEPRASTQTITINWSTNNEPDVIGFYVLRGVKDGPLSPIGDLIPHSGTNLVGKTYSLIDAGRVNGVTYDYRLQVVRGDGISIYSNIVSIAANPATITPTPTITQSPTPRPTNTPWPTFVPTRQPTRFITSTPMILRTSTPRPTSLVLPTRTNTLDMTQPGAPATATSLARTREALPAFPTSTLLGPRRTGTGTVLAPGKPGTPGTPGTPAATGYPVAMVSGTASTGYPAGGSGEEGTAEAGTPGAGTPDAATTGTPGATSSPTGSLSPGAAVGGLNASGGPSPWLSLLLGLLAGLAATGGLGAAWYFLRIRQ